MEVYQESRRCYPEESGAPIGTLGFPHTISSAKMRENDVLSMVFLESGKGPKEVARTFGYQLQGQELVCLFMSDMQVSSVDNLVGREVYALIPPTNRDIIQGLVVKV